MRIIEIEAEGKTIEEAVKNACKTLGVTPDDIEYTVIEEGSKGILGFNKQNAKIQVSFNTATPLIRKAKALINEVMELLGINADIKVRQEADHIYLDIYSDSGGLIIGKGGETINALQHLVTRVTNRDSDEKFYFVVDAEDYLHKRQKNIEELSLELAQKVKKSGKSILTDRMNPHDRRIVHITLRDDAAVVTKSKGDGFLKRVEIAPKKIKNSLGRTRRGRTNKKTRKRPPRI